MRPRNTIGLFLLSIGSLCAATPALGQVKVSRGDTARHMDAQLEKVHSLIRLDKARLIYSEDFDRADMSEVGPCSGNCPDLVHESDGNPYMRARLDGGMAVPYRTEITFRRRENFLNDNGPYLIYFKVRFHRDTVTDFPKSIFFQFHGHSKNRAKKEDFWESLAGHLRPHGDTLVWHSERAKGISSGLRGRAAVTSGVWHEILIIFNPSESTTGQVTVYRNGVKEFEAYGSNSGPWQDGQYLKLGIYASAARSHRDGPTRSMRMIDYDDVLVAHLAQVCPLVSGPCQWNTLH